MVFSGKHRPSALVQRLRSPDFIIGLLLLVATYVLCVFPLIDTDFWWHLKTGQLIGERGAVPRTDWFLFSDSDRPWIDLHWGFQLTIAFLYWLGGVNLVILVKAAVLTAAVGVGWFAVGEGTPAWVRAAVWIPAVICISGRGYERPEIVTQLFLAMWLWIAFRVEREPRWIWGLPLIQVIWINFHALFVLGLIIGGCFAIDYVMRRLAAGQGGLMPLSPSLTSRTLIAGGTACGVAALINPYLIEGALFPLELYRKFSADQEFYAQRIGEFQAPLDFFLVYGFRSIYLNAQLLLGGMGVVSFGCSMAVTRRWSPFRLLVFAAFSNLALEATRNVNIFAITVAVLTVANLNDCWRVGMAASENAKGNRSGKDTKSITHSKETLVAGLLIVWIITVVTGGWGRWTGEGKPFGLGEKAWWFGHEAVRFAGQSGFPDRAIVAHIGLAATYEFHNGPDRKVWLDPRLEVCTRKTFQRQETILDDMARLDRSWEFSFRDAAGHLPVVILDSRTSRPMINGLLQTPGWRLVYADPAGAVFLSELQADQLNLPTADFRPLLAPP